MQQQTVLHRGQHRADAGGALQAARQTKRHIRAELRPKRLQSLLRIMQPPQHVQSGQRRRRVSAAAAQPRRHGHALFQVHLRARLHARVLRQQPRRAQDQIVVLHRKAAVNGERKTFPAP